ncbi:hypothetical protein C1N58_22060 (plasmid) [Pantoea sp. SGAir0180]
MTQHTGCISVKPPGKPASARPAAVLPFRLLPESEKVGSGGERLPVIAVKEYKQAIFHIGEYVMCYLFRRDRYAEVSHSDKLNDL